MRCRLPVRALLRLALWLGLAEPRAAAGIRMPGLDRIRRSCARCDLGPARLGTEVCAARVHARWRRLRRGTARLPVGRLCARPPRRVGGWSRLARRAGGEIDRTGERLPRLDGRRILVVDDDPLLADALQLLLADLGADVMRASDGADGVELALRHRPDVILCDLQMPRLDGARLVRRIRQDPRLSSLPVIAMSATITAADLGWLVAAGFDGGLPKPFRPADVSAVLGLTSARRPAA